METFGYFEFVLALFFMIILRKENRFEEENGVAV